MCFIPSLSGRSSLSDVEREWLALPYCCGGLGMIYPHLFSEQQYQALRAITQPLVRCLRSRCKELPFEVLEEQKKLISEFSKLSAQEMTTRTKQVRESLPSDRQRLMDVACEHGASIWLSALPLREHGFDLHKGSFRDALCIRYG